MCSGRPPGRPERTVTARRAPGPRTRAPPPAAAGAAGGSLSHWQAAPSPSHTGKYGPGKLISVRLGVPAEPDSGPGPDEVALSESLVHIPSTGYVTGRLVTV